jgi:hypothetical protein
MMANRIATSLLGCAFLLGAAPATSAPPSGPVQSAPRDSARVAPLDTTASRRIWFEDLGARATFDPAVQGAMASYVAAALDGRVPPDEAARALAEAGPSPRIVFLSLGDARGPARVFRGAGEGLRAALDSALVRARSTGEDTGRTWRKVDVVADVESFADVGLRSRLRLDRGIDGVAFERASGIAFLPDEVLAWGLAGNSGALEPERIAAYLSLSGPDLGSAFTRLAASPRVTTYRFTTTSLFIDGEQAIPLFRGHRLFSDLAAADLDSAAAAGGRYLVGALHEVGRFSYSYFPKSGTTRTEYNILRHAGTAYAMLEVYEVTGDKEIREAARRALEYLIAFTKPFASAGETLACVVDDGDANLGANGLACLAIAKYIEVTGDRQWLPLLRRLAGWMRAVQSYDGAFRVHKQTFPRGPSDGVRSAYYDGEALFALVRVFELDHDPVWLDCAERGARYLIETAESSDSTWAPGADHWLLYSLNELYPHRRRPEFLRHARRLATAIIESQNRERDVEDWYGSYNKPPRSTPAAARSEGLCAAWWLERKFGDKAMAERILEAIRLGVAFQLQCQFRPESAMYLDAPDRALGGFHETLTDYEIRIDFVQHNISGILGLSRILRERPGTGGAK